MGEKCCFQACWASFFAEVPLEVPCRASFFAGEPLDAPCWASFFAEVPLEGPCWANYFAEGRWKPRVGWVFSRDPALRPGLVGGAAPFMSVAVGVLQH